MTASLEVAAEVRRLYFGEHWKRGTIATQLGLHVDVVVRILGTFGPTVGTPRPGARVLEPYEPFIDETLARYPRLVATRIHDMISARGYSGALRTLRRYVRRARPRPKSEVFVRVETLPGEQAQVDWAHVGTLVVPGGTRPLWAFVMVLAHSRAMWAELVVDLSAWSLRRSLVRAAQFFQGSTRQWLFDNAKVVVVERRGDAVRFHDDLLDLAARLLSASTRHDGSRVTKSEVWRSSGDTRPHRDGGPWRWSDGAPLQKWLRCRVLVRGGRWPTRSAW